MLAKSANSKMLVKVARARDTGGMESEVKPESAAPRKRRWLQFSTRSLLVVVAVSGVTLGVIGRRAERQREAVAAFEAMGGTIYYDHQPSAVARTWAKFGLPRDWVEEVTIVQLDHPNRVTDSEMPHLRALTDLKGVCMIDCELTDAGLANFEGLIDAEILILGGNNKVTDAGLIHLQALRRLRHLVLNDTQVTDAGLAHLQKLTALERLSLGGSRVTSKGVAELQEALPDCTISH
jgi:hypothetical protein